jgi:2-keto-3-deoxy-L-rhamnonate aldolase RhmA
MPGKKFHPDVKKYVFEAARLIVNAGRYAGTSVNKDITQEYVDAGFRFIYEHANAMFASGAKEFQQSFVLNKKLG